MLANNIQKTVDAIYPVGALYLSMNATNPEQLFGGSWKQLTADAYLKIVTSGASETAKGQTDHKIPVSSMPSHNHDLLTNNTWSSNAVGLQSSDFGIYRTRGVAGVEQSGGTLGRVNRSLQDNLPYVGETGGGGHTIRAISEFMSGIARLKSLLQGGAVC